LINKSTLTELIDTKSSINSVVFSDDNNQLLKTVSMGIPLRFSYIPVSYIKHVIKTSDKIEDRMFELVSTGEEVTLDDDTTGVLLKLKKIKNAICVSSTGQYLCATTYGGTTSVGLVSTNFGASWTEFPLGAIDTENSETDVSLFRLVCPDDNDYRNPMYNDFLVNYGVQFISMKFYTLDSELKSYENFFLQHMTSFVPISSAIATTMSF
jgi:hypothetical protein